jgi:hypothetical protein
MDLRRAVAVLPAAFASMVPSRRFSPEGAIAVDPPAVLAFLPEQHA